MIPSGNGLFNQITTNSSVFTYNSASMRQYLEDFLTQVAKDEVENRYINMRQDLNREELSIGDRILVCSEKEYGWLGYATIIAETNLSWKIELEDTNTYNRKRNFEKNPKRILKVA